MSLNGKLLIDGPVQSYPFRIPMSLKDAMMSEPFIQAVKTGLELRGVPVGLPRRPLAETDPDARERIKAALATLGD
ncbi:dihydrodipicolinate synthase family protein [Brevibacterium sp. VCM10]|uniref:dihydrodipicolinate synthase family protein n=1 Tax=Brevibacterium sp. VCM10 TaxID=1381751 RepID=UPI0004B8A11D|nr:dihydrodipicolinate synthase family protein [Brevibacterium sp. VCM10]